MDKGQLKNPDQTQEIKAYRPPPEDYLYGLCIAFLCAPAGTEEEECCGRAFRLACLRLGKDWEKLHDEIVQHLGGAVATPDWSKLSV